MASSAHILKFLLLGLMLALNACVESSSGSRRGVSSAQGGGEQKAPEEADSPDFGSDLNYLQNGSFQTTSALNISVAFEDSLYLRGKQIDQFIRNGNTSRVQCLLAPFPNSADKKILVLSATPRYFTNFSENTREYYYLINAHSASNNQSFCQKTGLINAIDLTYQTSAIAYSVSTVCPQCFESLFTSSALALYDPSGAPSNNVRVNNLSLRLTNTPGSNIPDNATCTTSSQCRSQGFDCCSENQCVRDKQIKSSTDQGSGEFQQALIDIQANSANIFNYPHFFHLCSQNPGGEDDDDNQDPIDPELDALERFIALQELYQCTTPIEGEMALCTVTYNDVTDSNPRVFFTGADDRSFTSTYTGTTGILPHSITKIEYAGQTLFRHSDVALNGAEIGPNNSQNGNDNVDDPLQVTITRDPLPSAPNDRLKITYKIDGSCVPVNQNLARCTKYYTQGQNLGRVDDHFPASNQFLIPYYADINRTIKVEVDGTAKLVGTQWNVVPTSPAYIEFNGTGLQVFDTQKVAITYFVDMTAHKVLVKKQEALQRIKEICQCADTNCSLRPEVDPETQQITDYACVYPDPDVPPPPLQQTVLVSSKTAPHRYYDQTGVYQNQVDASTPPQEGRAFQYTNNDPLRPNNVDQYIGFNEIYGSFGIRPGQALPAKEVRVVNGKTYDIFVDSGSFSSCLVCGNDYYSSLKRLFPNSLGNPGSGYTPSLTDTDRTRITDFRSDDLTFGRACFVPATMIPWSHTGISDLQLQRQRRLQTQHFYYANGYRSDWFGFDYGSLIGSFDGVRWFSIGSQRRIKASSSRLFIAVNAYHADLTQESTFKVVVSDASNIPASGSTVTTDFDSDGAQCQRLHTCQTDRDCATTLGWDYACESITNLSTTWPSFDSNGNEIPNANRIERLQNLFGANKGGVRRCVYRGRGAACQRDLEVNQFTLSFNQATTPGLLGCSSNNYCQSFSDGSDVSRFNTKSARWGRSVANQNASQFVSESNLDTFGKGARIIGRPMSYQGSEVIPTEVLSNMNVNNIAAVCIPGRNPQATNINSQNSSIPGGQFIGDKVLGIGMTASGEVSPRYLNACSVFDTDNKYYHLKIDNILDPTLGQTQNDTLKVLAGSQAIPTNAIKVFEGMLSDRLVENFETEQITNYMLEENRCLRAPGSACFTDQDCAPNRRITEFLRDIDPEDTSLHPFLNMYELYFWKERLVCGQEVGKDDESYDLKKNRCCRETGNMLNIGTLVDQQGFISPLSSTAAPNFLQTAIPGVDIALNDSRRLTRMMPVLPEMMTAATAPTHPPLIAPRANRCTDGAGCFDMSDVDFQFNTLDKVARRTCCSGNWIRHWDSTDNGGGHRWAPEKHQIVEKQNFRCLNWLQDPTANLGRNFTCAHTEEPDDPDCFSRAITSAQAAPILRWLGKFEALGIPQVAIETIDFAEIDCSVSPTQQWQLPNPASPTIPGFIETSEQGEYIRDGRVLYSAADMTNFNSDKKKIFSEDQFSCCLPAGTEVAPGTNRDQCCTGFINGITGRCALPDFTNVSLYLNRYVSSEGANLDASLFDLNSGFIENPSFVEQIACEKKICASGVLARGVVHSPLSVRGHEGSEKVFRRFIDGNDDSNDQNGLATLFDTGLRWNNHVYCVPDTIDTTEVTLKVTPCPQ